MAGTPIGDPGNVLEIPTPPATGNVLEIPSQLSTASDIIGTTTAIVGDLSQVNIVIAEGLWSVSLSNPITAAIMVLFQALEWLGIIPNPLEELFGLFVGRPREEATAQVIKRLQHSPNAAARMWGIQLSKMLTNMDIVISDSSAFGQMMLGRSYRQFVNNLQWQGITKARAQQIALHALSREAQAGAPLEPELQKLMNPQLSLVGPKSMLDILNEGQQIAETKGLTGLQAQHFAENYLYKHEVVYHLQESLWVNKVIIPGSETQPGFPPPTPPPVNPSQLCWCYNPQTQQWSAQPPTNGGGQPSLQPPNPPDPNGDELSDCCAQTAQYMYSIAQSLQNLPNLQGGGADAGCCAQIVQALIVITQSLDQIANAMLSLGTGGGDPPDLTQIAATLQAIADAISAGAAHEDANADKIANAIATLRDALGVPKDIDLRPIIDLLKQANELADVPPEIIQQMVKEGSISAEMGQLLGGSPFSHVAAGVLNAVAKFLGGELGQIEHGLGALFINIIKPWALALFKIVEADAIAVIDYLVAKIGPWFTTLKPYFIRVLEIGTDGVEEIPKLVLQATEALLTLDGEITPENSEEAGFRVLGFAFITGQVLHFAASLGGKLFYPVSAVWAHNAHMAVELLGYESIMHELHRNFFPNAFGIPQRYHYQEKFRPFFPNDGIAAQMFARRKIDRATLDKLVGFAGLHETYVAPRVDIAFRPLQPRAISAMIADTPFNRDTMREVLQDAGYTDAHVEFMLDLLAYNSTKNLRNSYISQVESGYAHGIVSDDELSAAVDDAGWSPEAKSLVQKTALLRRRQTLASEVETQVTGLVSVGLMDQPTAVQQMEAAGVQEWQANLKATLAETKAVLAQARRDANAERRAELMRQRNLTHAAIAQFQSGAISETELTAGLLLIGLDALTAASIVTVQTAIRNGKLKFIYGQLLNPAQAELMRQHVAAIEAQLKKQLTTIPIARAELTALNIPAQEVKELLARWAAEIGGATKTGQLLET
jgi:hypothetical protein